MTNFHLLIFCHNAFFCFTTMVISPHYTTQFPSAQLLCATLLYNSPTHYQRFYGRNLQ